MRPVPRLLFALCLALAGTSWGCSSPDPKAELEVSGLETYWAIDSAVGERLYIAPVARFQLRNKGRQELRSIQISASFRRKGEEQIDWGSAFEQIAPARKPMPPGQTTSVMLRSDGRYYSSGAPESFFEHKLFKDARAQVYVRIGASPWVLMAEADVERRIGTRALGALNP